YVETIKRSLDGLDIPELMPSLGSRHDREALPSGLFGCREDFTNSGCVRCDGLLHKDMFTGVHGGFEVNRAESGWRRQDHHVNAACHYLLVGIQAGEAAVITDIHFGPECAFQIGARGVQAILEGIAHRIDLDVFGRGDTIVGGAASATSTPDESD